MSREIAVYVNTNGDTASLKEKGKVVVYCKRTGRWEVLKEKEFSPGTNSNMKELRYNMAEMIDFIGDGKVFVGLSVTGIPYFELEKSNYSVWEFQGQPPDYLDFILEQEEEERNHKPETKGPAKPPVPVEISDGRYRISIKGIQENNIGFTSKQVLLPFLRQGGFYSLEIFCNHVPPWLETELATDSLYGVVEQMEKDLIRVIITRKCCD